MSTDRSELHDLVDAMADEDIAMLLAAARDRSRLRSVRSSHPFAWFGSIDDGPSDASTPERIDDVLARGFGRS